MLVTQPLFAQTITTPVQKPELFRPYIYCVCSTNTNLCARGPHWRCSDYKESTKGLGYKFIEIISSGYKPINVGALPVNQSSGVLTLIFEKLP